MALSRFVLTATVTIPAGTPTADANGFGLVSFSTGSAGTTAWAEGMPVTIPKGTVIYADSTSPGGVAGNGPQQLYIAIGAGNLRPYVQGQDDVGHAALSN